MIEADVRVHSYSAVAKAFSIETYATSYEIHAPNTYNNNINFLSFVSRELTLKAAISKK